MNQRNNSGTGRSVPAPQNNFGRNLPVEDLNKIRTIFQSKTSIVWLFIISVRIEPEYRQKIQTYYNGFGKLVNKYVSPLYQKVYQAQNYFQITNAKLKIVSDIENIQELLKFAHRPIVDQIHIYNQRGERGFQEAIQAKLRCEKVKGIVMDLEEILEQAEDQAESDLRIYQQRDNSIKVIEKRQRIFPNYIFLSGVDRTKATLYRSNLYAAKNLSLQQKQNKFEQFRELVHQKYKQDRKEDQNIVEYEELNNRHEDEINSLEEAGRIINFYTKETFYYRTLNLMLKKLKSPTQFIHIMAPFHETYKSIKMYYRQTLLRNKRKIPAMTVYRGGKEKGSQLNRLTVGSFIEMFGFMSTSRQQEVSRGFIHGMNGLIFKIKIPEMEIPEKFDQYDHGFVILNDYNLSDKPNEDEVLFNALNLFKVTRSRYMQGGYQYIDLEYGSIFRLAAKKNLNPKERQVFSNYKYCAEMQSKVQDEGDTFRIHNQLDKSEEYYKNRLNNRKNYYKLAKVQHQKGNLGDAQRNAEQSLRIELENFDRNDRQKCMKVCSIHTKITQIKLDQQDFVNAQAHMNQAIQLFSPNQISLEKAKKLRERGEVFFKKGDVKKAEADFNKSEEILQRLMNDSSWERIIAKKDFIFSHFNVIFSDRKKQKVDKDYLIRLQEIQFHEQRIDEIKQQILKEQKKVNDSLTKVWTQVSGNKDKYKQCVAKGRKIFLKMRQSETDDVNERATLLAMEATVDGYVNLVQSQNKLKEAISLIQRKEPFNQNVGKFSQLLAEVQRNQILNPSQRRYYQSQKQAQLYNRCKNNFRKALGILKYHKKNHTPEALALSNQQGEMDLNLSNFSACEELIKSAKSDIENSNHTEVVKSQLLLQKIAYSRGQLKYSFQILQKAKKKLKKSLVKIQNDEKYLKVYRCHTLYLQLKAEKVRVYVKQMNHDLALNNLQCIYYFLDIKTQGKISESKLLPGLKELQGQIVSLKPNKLYDCDQYFEEGIKIRSRQQGKYMLENGKAYSNYSKHLLYLSDFAKAEEMLVNAINIFSKILDDSHPSTWDVKYLTNLFKLKTQIKKNPQSPEIENYLKEMQRSVEIMKTQCDISHLLVYKVQVDYALNLVQSGKVRQGIRQYERLNSFLDQNIRATRGRLNRERIRLQKSTDDQKIYLKRGLYHKIKNAYQLLVQRQINIRESNIKIQNYNQRIEKLNKDYHFDV